MKNEEILKELDEIDKYMVKNVEKNGKIKNSQDVFARMHLARMQEISRELRTKNVGPSIKNRFEQTENALLYATDNASLSKSNQYFLWLDSVKQNKSVREPDYMQLFYEMSTGHKSVFRTNYIQERLGKNSEDMIGLLYNIGDIQQEYDEFRNQDKGPKENALAIRKRNPIQRLFDKIFKRESKPIKKEPKLSMPEPEYDGHEVFCKNLNNDVATYRSNLEKTVRQQAIDTQPRRVEKRRNTYRRKRNCCN